MTSSYKYKGNRLDTIIKGVTNTSNFTNYKTLSLTTQIKDFNNTINEGPLVSGSIGYYNNTTDLTTFCIANYWDISTITNNFNIKNILPSWCNKIRGILVGPGGYGKPSYTSPGNQSRGTLIATNDGYNSYTDPYSYSNSTNLTKDITYTNTNTDIYIGDQGTAFTIYKYYFRESNYNVVTGPSNYPAGAPGGGGGYYYFNTVDISAYRNNTTITIGNFNSNISGNTELSIGTTKYIAYAGQPSSEGQSTPINVAGSGSSSGGSASTSGLKNVLANPTNIIIGNIGNGGSGGTAGSANVVNPGNAPKPGFARIYFVAN
jgi:hypothetical protein